MHDPHRVGQGGSTYAPLEREHPGMEILHNYIFK